MPQLNGLSLPGALAIATANKTRMANSKVRLFKQGLTPDSATPLTTYVANEADFDGYAAITVAAWGDPVLFGNGFATYAPNCTFRWVFDTEGTGNMIGGYWTETAGGVLVDYVLFETAQPIQGPSQAVIVTPLEWTPAGGLL